MLTSAGVGMVTVAAGLLSAGATLNYPEVVQVGAAGVAAVALSAGLAWRRPRVGVRIRLPAARAVDGDAPRLSVTLANRGRWRCFMTLLQVDVGDVPVSIELGSVGAGASVEHNLPLPPLRRGVYPVSAAKLAYRDPFGFARADHTVGVSGTLHVHPRTEVLAPMPAGGPEDRDGRPLLNAAAGGDSFYSLREYAPGDNWRTIHWPSTARLGTLMVRHTTVSEETSHAVLVDTERQAYEEEEYFERAVQIAGSVSRATLRARHGLTLFASPGLVVQPAVEEGEEDDVCGSALDLLAGARLSDMGVDPGPLRAVPVGACLMVVSGRPRPALVGWLSDVSRHVSASYLVQVLGSAQRPVDPPAGVRALTVDGLDSFRASWRQWSRP
jgi:uncharacterized protein (DUF58 family)